MKRSVKLTRWEAGDEVDLGLYGAIRLRITASDPLNMEAAVFVWHRLPKSPFQDEAIDVVSHIASAADMAEFPVDEPTLAGIPYFRRSYVDFLFRSTTECEAAWERAERDVGVLVESLKALDVLSEVSTVCIGDCDDSASV